MEQLPQRSAQQPNPTTHRNYSSSTPILADKVCPRSEEKRQHRVPLPNTPPSLQWAAKVSPSKRSPTLDIYKDSLFAEFRATLDAEMKRLQRLGIGSKTKQAEPLTEEEEEILWQKGLLGDHTPQALLNTMVFMSGLYFALRSGREHRELRFDSSQISLVECGGERPYLEYTEDDSKNRPAGLKGRYIERKTVKHHANLSNPSRCFVRLFSLYRSRCPANPKRNSFYLQCLKKPTEKVWFSREPLGHNALSKIIQTMCNTAGIPGFRTNHSLRATSATRLYAAGMDEQLIMERTGHRSVGGVRSYKHTSDEQQQNVSDTLSLAKRPKVASPSSTTQLSTTEVGTTSHVHHRCTMHEYYEFKCLFVSPAVF